MLRRPYTTYVFNHAVKRFGVFYQFDQFTARSRAFEWQISVSIKLVSVFVSIAFTEQIDGANISSPASDGHTADSANYCPTPKPTWRKGRKENVTFYLRGWLEEPFLPLYMAEVRASHKFWSTSFHSSINRR